jgi:chromate transporter
MADPDSHHSAPDRPGSAGEVFIAFLKLGLVSFGGPVAHLGYFNDAFVARRKWLTASAYAEIVALCQFLPGPASSQVGITLGLARAGLPGALAAWLGFTLPSAIIMVLFAYGVREMGDVANAPWLHGLKLAAVAVVAQAVVVMARMLCPDPTRIFIAAGAAVVVIFVPGVVGQVGAIALGGLLGLRLLRGVGGGAPAPLPVDVSKTAAHAAFISFVLILAALAFAATSGDLLISLADRFYRTGALVFGGGHVVLPLLQSAVVPPGWLSMETFLAGYGAAQSVPGPLFTFAAFLGAAIAGPWGALVCLIAIFLPSFLLIVGVVPYWTALRRHAAAGCFLKGVNAAVVGLLAAALYNPIFPSAIDGPLDMAIAGGLFALLMLARVPSWMIAVLGAASASAARLL